MTSTATAPPFDPSTAPIKRLTFEEYRFYEDGTDTRYELHRGKLIPMPTASGLHSHICQFLLYCLQQYLATTELNLIAVHNVGVRTGEDSSRIPDLVVCKPEFWEQVCSRKGAGILDLEEAPNLVVEITSQNWRDDYILKRAEYAMINVPEYWLVDPHKKRVRVFSQPEREDGYIYQEFVEGQGIESLQFSDLKLTVDKMINPPIVESLIKSEKAQFRQLEEQLKAETKRAERLAALLRENGIDPDQ